MIPSRRRGQRVSSLHRCSQLHLIQHGSHQLSHGRGQKSLRYLQDPIGYTLGQGQAFQSGTMGKMIAIALQQIVRLGRKASGGMTPVFKGGLRHGRSTQVQYLQGYHARHLTKHSGRFGLNARSKKVFLTVHHQPGMRNGLDRVGWTTQKLSR